MTPEEEIFQLRSKLNQVIGAIEGSSFDPDDRGGTYTQTFGKAFLRHLKADVEPDMNVRLIRGLKEENKALRELLQSLQHQTKNMDHVIEMEIGKCV
jgi:hypothetical protein